MRRWLLAASVWIIVTAVLLPLCGFAAIMLAGPHSDLLPSFLQPPAFLFCLAILLVVPFWLGRKVWRKQGVPDRATHRGRL